MTWSMRRHQLEWMIALTCGVGAGVIVIALTRLDVPLKVVALIVGTLVGLIVALVTRDIKRLLIGLIFIDLATGFDVHVTCNEDYFLSTCGFNISVTMLALILLYGLWIISLRRRHASLLRRPILGPIGTAGGIFVFAAIVSIVAAQNVTFALYQTWIYIQLFFLLFYLVNNINSQQDVIFIIYLLVMGLTIQALVMEMEVFGIVNVEGVEKFSSRITGTFKSANTAGGYLSQMALIMLAALMLKLPRWHKPLIALVLILALHNLIGTESRGGWISFVSGAIVIAVLSTWKKWLTPKAVIRSLIVIALVFAFFSGPIIERLVEDDRGAAAARGPLMEIALNMVRANPIIGVGANNFGVVLHDFIEVEQFGAWLNLVHNGWMLIWSELGTLGFLAYAAFWATTAWHALKLIRSGHPLYGVVALGFLASMCGAAAHMMVEIYGSRIQLQPIWTGAAVIMALVRLQEEEASNLQTREDECLGPKIAPRKGEASVIHRRKLARNSLAILANQLAQNGTAFLLSMAIARILGPFSLGQYSLAISYYFVFMTISSQGFKTLFTRELAQNPNNLQLFLVSGTVMQFGFSAFAYVVLVVVVSLLPYNPETTSICYIVGLALIPFGLSNVTEAVFQAQEKMHLITLSTVPVYILRFATMFVALKLGFTVHLIGVIFVISETIIVAIEWGFMLRLVAPLQWRVDWPFVIQTVRSARTFLAVESIAVLKLRMQVVILSLLAGETVVGLYTAAVQLLQPLHLISQSLMVSAFPSMSRTVELGRDPLRRLTETLISVLLVVAVPMIIGCTFLGSDLMVFIYRNRGFTEVSTALVIVSLSLIPLTITRVLGFLLIANGYERINLRIVMFTTVMGSVLSLLLISQFQMIGAALAALLVELISAAQFVYAVRAHIFSLRAWNIIRYPLLVSGLMAGVFVLLQNFDLQIIVNMVIAVLAYALFAGMTVVQMLGLRAPVLARLRR